MACNCRTVHGNADDDGICRECRPKHDRANAKREADLMAACTRLGEQLAALPPYSRLVWDVLTAVDRVFSELEHPACPLCYALHCQDDCAQAMFRRMAE